MRITTNSIDIAQVDRAKHSIMACLFSHFDSRGGSTLKFEPSVKDAIDAYAKVFVWDDTKETADFAFETALNDFEGVFQIITCDGVLPDEGEIMKRYGGEFRVSRMQYRFMRWSTGQPSKWLPMNVLVLWKGRSAPKVKGDESYGYRLVPAEAELGEDAFGLLSD